MRWSDELHWVCALPSCHHEFRRNYMFPKHWRMHQKPPVRLALRCKCSKNHETLTFEPPQVEERKSNCIKEVLALCECPPGKDKFVSWIKMYDDVTKIAGPTVPTFKVEPKSPTLNTA